MIGIMVPDIRGYFESQSAYELEKNLDSFAYTTLLCVTTDENEKIVNVYIDEIEAIDRLSSFLRIILTRNPSICLWILVICLGPILPRN